jgi:aspartyl-tRNA synthetase
MHHQRRLSQITFSIVRDRSGLGQVVSTACVPGLAFSRLCGGRTHPLTASA